MSARRRPVTSRGLVVTGLTVSATTVAATVLALAGPSSASSTVIARDDFARTTAAGLGAAEVGGEYATVSQATSTSVSDGAARIAGLQPGGTFQALLPGAQATDTDVRVAFVLPALPTTGRGLTTTLILRRSSAGAEYDAKVRVLPTGGMLLSFSQRTVGSAERFLDGEVAVPGTAAPGQQINFEASVAGTSSVRLMSRAWIGTGDAPSFQVEGNDGGTQAVVGSGSIGLMSYVSRSSAAMSVDVTGLTGWNLAPASSSPSTTVSPTTTAPTTTAPTTAPTTTAPTTAPTTTKASTTVPPTTAPTTTVPPTTQPTTTVPPTTAPAPPAGPDPAGVGSAPIGSTSYAVPSGATYVSTSGSDTAAGTEASPYRTLAHAVAVVPSGTTIVLRAGTYHESVEIPYNKPGLTIESAPREAVYLDGSSAVTNWTQQGSTWVSNGWTAQFDPTPSYTGGEASEAQWTWINPAYPMASHPDQMWINGVKLAQVGSLGQVTSGTFYADYANQRLVIGSNPTGQAVRSSDIAIALTVRSANVTIRGLGVTRYATEVKDFGAVRLLGTGDSVENASFNDIATTGLAVLASSVTVNHVTANDDGLLGMFGNYADHMRMESTLIEGDNNEHFNQGPVAGGFKIQKSRTFTVDRSVIDNNYATGLWMDDSNYDGTFTNNTVSNNTGHGIFYEISAKAIIANNTVSDNGGDGLKINNSDQVRIWNNTLVGNGRNIELVQDSRIASDPNAYGRDPRQPNPDPTVTWVMKNDQVMNNILSVGGGYNIYSRDYTNARSGSQMNLTINGNLFTQSPSSGQAELIWALPGGALQTCLTVSDIAKTGAGSNNLEKPATLGLGAFASPAGQPLPSDIAALIGLSPGATIIGAS